MGHVLRFGAGQKTRDPVSAAMAKRFYMEQGRILKEAFIRVNGPIAGQILEQFEDIQRKIKRLEGVGK